ncbi:MAG: nif-specific transcriptional activator NifA [Methyloversatilis sp.]|uniref:nif-specific transcriptional activator NifA n=1 Tax=Methyloversatilis sp. TaxID=2569862 RepID=UPI0027360D2F|nr:nif-specific transcriptional activator NifA [Methyloversatilis sp.]MDP3872102.1 nif-specific transcriptional activator NifA [Methyloversatilis sp.]
MGANGVELNARANVELVTVYEISKILSSSLDVTKTLREALNVLAHHLDFRRAMIALADEDGESLSLAAAVGLSAKEWASGRYRAGEGILGRIYRSGSPMVVPDISVEPLFLNRTGALDEADGHTIAFIGVPIRGSSEALGVLCVDRAVTPRGSFSSDVRVLTMAANLVGQSVALRRVVHDEHERLLNQAKLVRRETRGRFKLDNVVGASPRMQEVFAEAHQVAPSRATVLLRGESGTGKEVIARAIHELSTRKGGPFIKLNCAALSESLLESELFGHEKGSFTGASAERKGRFELADGGTLFLDEIGDISPAFQTKLLRVLQEREFERVGGSRPIKVDVRLVCATNRNLEKMVAAGTFRADLYFRINVVSIFLPSLRERREDIPALTRHFLERFNRENDRTMKLAPSGQTVMMQCYWPGNVRELENCIERTATMAHHDSIEASDFPCSANRCLTQVLHFVKKDDAVSPVLVSAALHHPDDASADDAAVAAAPPARVDAGASAARPTDDDKPQGERERLVWAMEQCGWVQAKAARLLNITPRQMGYALKKYDIEVRRF